MLRIRGFPITGKEHPEDDVVSDSPTSSSSEEETDESEEESSEEGPDEEPEPDLEEISDEVPPTSLALEEVVKILETLSDDEDEEPSVDETSEEESSEESDESTESSSSSDDEGVPEPQEVDVTENLERMKEILQELRAEREKIMEEAQDLHHQAELFESIEFPHLVHDSVFFMKGKDTK